MANIKLYYNNPTAGGTDGTVASEDGAQTSPVTVTLDASLADEVTIPLALRCNSGFCTVGNTTITPSGTSAGKWTLCATSSGTFTSSLTIGTSIDATNTVFYAKVASSADETAQNDTSVTLDISCKIGAE